MFFLELCCCFDDPVDVGNLISGSSALKPAWTSVSSWLTYCWILAWRILTITLKGNCAVVWCCWRNPSLSSFFLFLPLTFMDFILQSHKTGMFSYCIWIYVLPYWNALLHPFYIVSYPFSFQNSIQMPLVKTFLIYPSKISHTSEWHSTDTSVLAVTGILSPPVTSFCYTLNSCLYLQYVWL